MEKFPGFLVKCVPIMTSGLNFNIGFGVWYIKFSFRCVNMLVASYLYRFGDVNE